MLRWNHTGWSRSCATVFPHSQFQIPNYPPHPYGGAVQADGITSANTVGYSGQEVKAGQFYMIGAQFADVQAATDVANFNNFFATTCAPGEYGDGSDGSMNGAPQIQVLKADGLTYTMYYFISDAYDAGDNPVDGNCWADDNGYIITDENVLALSKGFWFKAMTDGSITCAGQVSVTSEIENSPTANQFNIVANPFPTALALTEAKTANFVPGEYGDGSDGSMGNAPQIQLLKADGLTYTMFYYISDAYDAGDNPVAGNVWADDNGHVVTGTQIPVGQAFWVKSASAGSFTFSTPIK